MTCARGLTTAGGRTLAKVKAGKSGSKQSITRHPLFPATVALWFGALFGVGSLAIRPSLIEGLIVALGIDAIIPSAAPPLGATTRILLALTLAAIGGTLGAWLARNIARPRPAPAKRKRGAGTAGSFATATATQRSSGVAGSRRGRLALEDEGRPRREYVDHAPLPGGASILDVSQFDLDGFEADEPQRTEPIEPVVTVEQRSSEPVNGPQAQPEPVPIPQGAQVFQPIAAEPEHFAEAQIPQEQVQTFASADTPTSFARQPAAQAEAMDVPVAVSPTAQDEPHITDLTEQFGQGSSQPEPAPFAPPTDRAPFAPPSEQASFAAPDANLPDPGEEIAAREPDFEPDQTHEIVETEALVRLGGEPEDRFDPLPPKLRPGSIFDKQPASRLFTQPLHAQVSHVGWDAGPSNEPASRKQIEAPVAPPAEPDSGPVASVAAERIVAAPLDKLSHVELLERLALSMRAKRGAASVPEPAETVFASGTDEPARARIDVGELAQTSNISLAPPVPVIPAALRPIGFDEVDEADHLPTFVPPRYFAQVHYGDGEVRQAAPDAPSEQQEVVQADTQSEPQAADALRHVEVAEADELEQGYSSLLSVSRPGAGPQRFVRIEEPANHSAEIEPVVIFPGKEPISGEGPFTRPREAANTQPIDHAVERLAQDPQETDRALRAALANIQRMSGAA